MQRGPWRVLVPLLMGVLVLAFVLVARKVRVLYPPPERIYMLAATPTLTPTPEPPPGTCYGDPNQTPTPDCPDGYVEPPEPGPTPTPYYQYMDFWREEPVHMRDAIVTFLGVDIQEVANGWWVLPRFRIYTYDRVAWPVDVFYASEYRTREGRVVYGYFGFHIDAFLAAQENLPACLQGVRVHPQTGRVFILLSGGTEYVRCGFLFIPRSLRGQSFPPPAEVPVVGMYTRTARGTVALPFGLRAAFFHDEPPRYRCQEGQTPETDGCYYYAYPSLEDLALFPPNFRNPFLTLHQDAASDTDYLTDAGGPYSAGTGQAASVKYIEVPMVLNLQTALWPWSLDHYPYVIITTPYGWRNPKTKRFHMGVDFGFGPRADVPLVSMVYGKAYVGQQTRGGEYIGYGLYVIVEEDERFYDTPLCYLYAHLGALNGALFQNGSQAFVVPGTVLGTGDSTGYSTGNHLHLEVWQKPVGRPCSLATKGLYLNPMDVITNENRFLAARARVDAWLQDPEIQELIQRIEALLRVVPDPERADLWWSMLQELFQLFRELSGLEYFDPVVYQVVLAPHPTP